MSEAEQIAKAELIEVDLDSGQPRDSGKQIKVQFNPESLKVSFTNQISGGDQGEGAAVQFVAKSTTKLSLDLWFDATVELADGSRAPQGDVRRLTQDVAHFMRPLPGGDKPAPPGVRFLWGTFLFDGVMESMNESLDYFSEEGKPLRSKVSISLSRQDIQFEFGPATPPANSANPGLVPRQPARQGDTVQDVAARGGHGDDWRPVAEANGVDDPLRVPPGTPLVV